MAEKQPYAVLGAGSWGTALAILLARNGFPVRLWSHDPEHVQLIRDTGRNDPYLPDIELPTSIEAVSDFSEAIEKAGQRLIVVPSHAFSAVCEQLASRLGESDGGICWATKGLEPGSGRLLHEVATEIFGPARKLAVISGPTFATEVARGLPTAVSVASTDSGFASTLAADLSADSFRAYTSDDIVGVQLGGAAKNVMAIAAGIADGLGFGANTRAALITRGLNEIIQLGLAVGGKLETFMGLAGLGDLALTCTDNQSRNRRMGLLLAQGYSQEKARDEIGQEVEGLQAAREVLKKAASVGIEMPITEQTCKVLFEGLAPQQAVKNLLARTIKSE